MGNAMQYRLVSVLISLACVVAAPTTFTSRDASDVERRVENAILVAEREMRDDAEKPARKENLGLAMYQVPDDEDDEEEASHHDAARLEEAIGNEIAQEPASGAWQKVNGNVKVGGTLSARSLTVRDRLLARGIAASMLTPGHTGQDDDAYLLSA